MPAQYIFQAASRHRSFQTVDRCNFMWQSWQIELTTLNKTCRKSMQKQTDTTTFKLPFSEFICADRWSWKIGKNLRRLLPQCFNRFNNNINITILSWGSTLEVDAMPDSRATVQHLDYKDALFPDASCRLPFLPEMWKCGYETSTFPIRYSEVPCFSNSKLNTTDTCSARTFFSPALKDELQQ